MVIQKNIILTTDTIIKADIVCVKKMAPRRTDDVSKYKNTQFTFVLKKKDWLDMRVNPDSDFIDISDNEVDANDESMIRLRLISKTLRKKSDVRRKINEMEMEQNKHNEMAILRALQANRIETLQYHQNKARGGVGQYPGESNAAFVKRMKNNAASRKSRKKSKVSRATKSVRWKKLLEQNKEMRMEMRILRTDIFGKLELIEQSNKQHFLSDCFTNYAIRNFVVNNCKNTSIGVPSLESILIQMLQKSNWNFVEKLFR